MSLEANDSGSQDLEFYMTRECFRTNYNAGPLFTNILEALYGEPEMLLRNIRDTMLFTAGAILGNRLQVVCEQIGVTSIDRRLIGILLLQVRINMSDRLQDFSFSESENIFSFIEQLPYLGRAITFIPRKMLAAFNLFNTNSLIRDVCFVDPKSKEKVYTYIRMFKTILNGVVVGFFGTEFGPEIASIVASRIRNTFYFYQIPERNLWQDPSLFTSPIQPY